MATDSAPKESSQRLANPFSPAYVRRESGGGVEAGFARADLGASPGCARGVGPWPDQVPGAGTEPGHGPDDGLGAGQDKRSVAYPGAGVLPLAAAVFQGIDPAEREWWRHQHRRLQFRANLSLTLAGIALIGLGLLFSTNPFSSGSVGISSTFADYRFGAAMPGGTGSGPVTFGPDGDTVDSGQPTSSLSSGPHGAGLLANAVLSGNNQTAVAPRGGEVGGVRQSELEMQLLQLTSRVMALEEEQHAIDQALARLRYDRLDKATGVPGEAE